MDKDIVTLNRRALSTNVRRRASAAALAAVAFFAAGLSPVAATPIARADVEDSLGDLFLAHLSAALEPAAQAGAGGNALDASLTAFIDQLSGSVHDQIEAAITDPANAPLLDAINFPSVALFGRDLIGNGIDVGDPIPALGFLDQSSGPLADTFTGTNEGLLTPALSALHIDVGNLHDGGLLLGDNASGTNGASTPADTLPPISCNGTILGPEDAGAFITAETVVGCDGPAAISIGTEIYYDGIIPDGIPGVGGGITSATTTAATLCVPGPYNAVSLVFVLFPPGYTPITPELEEAETPIVDITCS